MSDPPTGQWSTTGPLSIIGQAWGTEEVGAIEADTPTEEEATEAGDTAEGNAESGPLVCCLFWEMKR